MTIMSSVSESEGSHVKMEILHFAQNDVKEQAKSFLGFSLVHVNSKVVRRVLWQREIIMRF